LCFSDVVPSAIHPLSLHDALPICRPEAVSWSRWWMVSERPSRGLGGMSPRFPPREMRCRSTALRTLSHSVSAEWESVLKAVERRSEEHTSELQSRRDLVCRLLLEK